LIKSLKECLINIANEQRWVSLPGFWWI
jgi:hypothetical protein